MPIYAYKCSACGHRRDVLQKLSDPLLTVCPACGADAFEKQLTAAGFQLKGSGWYVTDFRDGGKAAAKKDAADPAAGGDKADGVKADAAATPAADGGKVASAAPEPAAKTEPAAPAAKPSGQDGAA